MTDVRLPEALQAAIEAELTSSVRHRASGLSDAYRAMRPSSVAVAEPGDVAAYLATRLPATYAAVARVLDEVVGRLPDFAPATLLDVGAGPGTASWAAGEAFPDLRHVTMLDNNPGLLAMAGRLAAASPSSALAAAQRLAGSLAAPPEGDRRYDLILASYSLTELADDRLMGAVLALWQRCAGVLVIVEPGRTRDYRRLMAARAALFEAGARIVAPCPHEQPCPLLEGDWCHFSVRLSRSRAHREAKGGSLGYEDEKFSYLAVARPGLAAHPAPARVIRQPVVRKFEVELPLCTAVGLELRRVARRDGAAFKAARKLDWGDSFD